MHRPQLVPDPSSLSAHSKSYRLQGPRDYDWRRVSTAAVPLCTTSPSSSIVWRRRSLVRRDRAVSGRPSVKLLRVTRDSASWRWSDSFNAALRQRNRSRQGIAWLSLSIDTTCRWEWSLFVTISRAAPAASTTSWERGLWWNRRPQRTWGVENTRNGSAGRISSNGLSCCAFRKRKAPFWITLVVAYRARSFSGRSLVVSPTTEDGLRVLHESLRPRPAVELVGAETSAFLRDLDNRVAKSSAEMEAVRWDVESLWDEALLHDLTPLKEFVEKLWRGGLVTWRFLTERIQELSCPKRKTICCEWFWIVDRTIRCTGGCLTARWPQLDILQACCSRGHGLTSAVSVPTSSQQRTQDFCWLERQFLSVLDGKDHQLVHSRSRLSWGRSARQHYDEDL